MPYVAADWAITRLTGNIRYVGDAHGGASPSYATVLEAHRAWQDLADNASSSGDDELDITDENPSGRDTDNIIRLKGIYNIDDVASEHLYDGTVVQGSGGTEVIYDGVLNFGNPAVQIQLIQNGAVLVNDFWNQSSVGLNPDLAQGISHRFLVKVRDAGADIDGRRILGTARRFGFTYSEFLINGSSRGNNVLALKDAADLNNTTAAGTVAGWTGITNTTEGYASITIGGTAYFFYSEWNTNQPTRSINEFFERMKWLTREASASTIYGLNGELFRGISHEIVVDTPTGTFNAFESVSWAGGSGQMLAINSTTAATKMWIQLLTGVAPTDNQTITGGTSSATVDVNVTVTARTIATPFNNQSTGTAMIGSYGFGVEALDLTKDDKVFDLDNLQISPPNVVTYTVSGLVIGEDRLLVGPWDGSTLDNEGFPAVDLNQLSLNTLLNGAAETSVVTSAAIPTDTPTSGDIRIEMDDGRYREVAYTSWTGSTFTIVSTNFSGDEAAATNNVWIAYLDLLATATGESFQGTFLADRDLVVKDRDGGGTPIKEFIGSGLLTSTGGSITVIRTSDT